MSQLTYPVDPDIAFEGSPGDGAASAHFRHYTDPTNETLFGRAAIQGANDKEFQVPLTVTGIFLGVTRHTHDVDPREVPNATGAVPANNPVNIMTQGRIWVKPESAVAAVDDPVYYRHANAGADPEGVGRFRQDDDTASGDVTLLPVTQARWLTTGAIGELTLLEVNLP